MNNHAHGERPDNSPTSTYLKFAFLHIVGGKSVIVDTSSNKMNNLADLTEKLRLKDSEKAVLEQEIDEIKVCFYITQTIISPVLIFSYRDIKKKDLLGKFEFISLNLLHMMPTMYHWKCQLRNMTKSCFRCPQFSSKYV
jgi:hypothetical protein